MMTNMDPNSPMEEMFLGFHNFFSLFDQEVHTNGNKFSLEHHPNKYSSKSTMVWDRWRLLDWYYIVCIENIIGYRKEEFRKKVKELKKVKTVYLEKFWNSNLGVIQNFWVFCEEFYWRSEWYMLGRHNWNQVKNDYG